MDFLHPRCEVEIVNTSGVLRVTIRPKFNAIMIISEVAAVAVWVYFGWERELAWSLIERIFLGCAALGTITTFAYQLTGSEQIELSDESLRVIKSMIGWSRMREYRMRECTMLEWREFSS